MYDDPIQDLIHLYEDGALNRREIVRKLTKHTGSVAASIAALAAVGLGKAQTPSCPADTRVAETDPSILAESLTMYGAGGPLFVYQVRPLPFGKPLPAVLVIHENQGLTPYIKDVTRRIAKAGYVAIAVDLLSRQGGTSQFADATAATAAYNRTVPAERMDDMTATLETIRQQPYVKGDRLGAIGFCAGGNNVFNFLSLTDKLTAAAVYYGPAPTSVDSLAKINAQLLMVFPELDRGTTTALPNILTTLIANTRRYELHIYPNANHAFHNDTGARYDATAACDAWSKTLAFFDRTLNA